jgi:hypothetical protein
MIPTAEELLKNKYKLEGDRGTLRIDQVSMFMIEFAKLHVEAALKEALDDIPCLGSSTDIASYEEVEEAVLNAYPLTLIK